MNRGNMFLSFWWSWRHCFKSKALVRPVMCRNRCPIDQDGRGGWVYRCKKYQGIETQNSSPPKNISEFMFKVCWTIRLKMLKCYWNLNNHATIFFFKSFLKSSWCHSFLHHWLKVDCIGQGLATDLSEEGCKAMALDWYLEQNNFSNR